MSPSYSAIHREEVPSTQDLARSSFVDIPVLVTAQSQTRGRGRSGAPWQNAPRAIAASIAFRPAWPIVRLQIIPLLAGLAAASVMEGTSLKWPNDVMAGDEKVAGLLGELVDGVFVMGMGVNVWWPDPPVGVSALEAADPGVGFGRDLAEDWAVALLELLALEPEQWPMDRYRRLCDTLGREITWTPTGRGRAVDIGPWGALIVDADGERLELTSTSVSHIRASN